MSRTGRAIKERRSPARRAAGRTEGTPGWLTVRAIRRAETPLMRAASSGNVAAVRYLLARGADPNERDGSGQTALAHAALGVLKARGSRLRGRLRLPVARALVNAGAQVDAPDRAGQTPLFWASIAGDLPLARYLLARGADPNRPRGRAMCLNWADYYGHTDVALALIAAGANVSAPSQDGVTPLMDAAGSDMAEGDPRLVAAFRAAGADTNRAG